MWFTLKSLFFCGMWLQHRSVLMMIFTRWSTASFGEDPVSSKMELCALREHVHICNELRGPWFSVYCRAETVRGFLAGRFVTLWLVLGGFFGVLAWAL
jgi:hypothetical protein